VYIIIRRKERYSPVNARNLIMNNNERKVLDNTPVSKADLSWMVDLSRQICEVEYARARCVKNSVELSELISSLKRK
jgi:hypothetical protein